MDKQTAAALRARIEQHEPDGRISISYRVGGRGTDRSREVRFTRDGTLQSAAGEARLAADAAGEVFAALSASLPSLVTRPEARFPPDSVVGIVTLDVDGELTELLFLADEQQAATAGVPVPPVLRAIDQALATTRTQGRDQ